MLSIYENASASSALEPVPIHIHYTYKLAILKSCILHIVICNFTKYTYIGLYLHATKFYTYT